jgi:hypothetical protein
MREQCEGRGLRSVPARRRVPRGLHSQIVPLLLGACKGAIPCYLLGLLSDISSMQVPIPNGI